MPAGFELAGAVADAILYEYYLLYPYRRSSAKNQVRWQFGVLAPREWVEARGPVADGVAGSAESWWQQTECLLEAGREAAFHVRVRFLQVQARRVESAVTGGGRFRPVDRLEVDGITHLAFDEAVPRTGGAFVSALDAPQWAAAEAARCRNVRTFSVLAGRVGKPDVKPDTPSHIKGVHQGNNTGAYERPAGHHADGTADARRSTGVNPKKHDPIVASMPNLPPG